MAHNNKVLIRVDASGKIGLGHIVRCLTLAKSLQNLGVRSVFLSKPSFKPAIELIKQNGFKHYIVKNNSSIEEEIGQIKRITRIEQATTIVSDINNPVSFDSINKYREFLSELSKNEYSLFVFEDLAPDPYPGNFVIIPYMGAEEIIHKRNKRTRYLLGTKYFILRDEFRSTKKISVGKKIKTILISMGGVNPHQFTEKVLAAIALTGRTYKLKIFLTNLGTYDFRFLENFTKSYTGEIEMFWNCSDIANHMSQSDLAIINSGLTKYETLFLGLPGIILSNTTDHADLMKDFEKKTKSLLHLGYGPGISEREIADNILSLGKDHVLRKNFSANGQKIIDGKGSKRLALIIKKNFK